jgi:hypothetical protein
MKGGGQDGAGTAMTWRTVGRSTAVVILAAVPASMT